MAEEEEGEEGGVVAMSHSRVGKRYMMIDVVGFIVPLVVVVVVVVVAAVIGSRNSNRYGVVVVLTTRIAGGGQYDHIGPWSHTQHLLI